MYETFPVSAPRRQVACDVIGAWTDELADAAEDDEQVDVFPVLMRGVNTNPWDGMVLNEDDELERLPGYESRQTALNVAVRLLLFSSCCSAIIRRCLFFFFFFFFFGSCAFRPAQQLALQVHILGCSVDTVLHLPISPFLDSNRRRWG